MPPAGFQPTFPVSDRPQTHTLDCAATEFGNMYPLNLLLLLLLLLLT
jgi:hypothetical protein